MCLHRRPFSSQVTHEMEFSITNISASLSAYLSSLPPYHLCDWLCRAHFLWTLWSLAHFNAVLYLTYFYRALSLSHTHTHTHTHTDADSEESCVYEYCLCETWILTRMHVTVVSETRNGSRVVRNLTALSRFCRHYQRWQESLPSSFISICFPSSAPSPARSKSLILRLTATPQKSPDTVIFYPPISFTLQNAHPRTIFTTQL